MSTNRFINNASWLIFGQFARMIVSFFVGVVSARYLGTANLGTINYIASYISFFTSIIGLGLSGVIIYEFVNDSKNEGKILGTAIFLRFIVSLISVPIFFIVIFTLDGNDKTIITVAFLQSLQLPFLCFDTINYWYQYKSNSKYAVIAQIFAYFVSAVYKVFLLVTGKSVEWFAFSASLDYIILALFYVLLYNKHKIQKLGVSKFVAKRLLKICVPFVLSDVMVFIYGQLDRIMIKQMLDSTSEVGLYSAALTICTIISFIPKAFLDSSRPLIAEAKLNDEELYRLRFTQLVCVIIWISFIYSAFVTVFSKFIVYIMYGEEYMGAVTCLKIAVWYTAFSYLGSARNFWLICENKKKYVFIFSAFGAVANIILNLVLIPVWGINGAAFATFLTQFLANFVIPFFVKDTREYGRCVVDALVFRNVKINELSNLIKRK